MKTIMLKNLICYLVLNDICFSYNSKNSMVEISGKGILINFKNKKAVWTNVITAGDKQIYYYKNSYTTLIKDCSIFIKY